MTQSAKTQAVIKELCSGYQSRGGGPEKEIMGVTLAGIMPDAENDSVTARVDVIASVDTYDGQTKIAKASFDLTLADMRELAQEAPCYKDQFGTFADQMAAELQGAREPLLQRQAAEKEAKDKKHVDDWCDEGLPTQDVTPLMKPLRFKP